MLHLRKLVLVLTCLPNINLHGSYAFVIALCSVHMHKLLNFSEVFSAHYAAARGSSWSACWQLVFTSTVLTPHRSPWCCCQHLFWESSCSSAAGHSMIFNITRRVQFSVSFFAVFAVSVSASLSFFGQRWVQHLHLRVTLNGHPTLRHGFSVFSASVTAAKLRLHF